MWDLNLLTRIEPARPALEGKVSTTRPPEGASLGDSWTTSKSKYSIISMGGYLILNFLKDLLSRIYSWSHQHHLGTGLQWQKPQIAAAYLVKIFWNSWFIPECTCMLSHFSHVQLFETVWTIACQAPLSMGFSREECWSGLLFLPPGNPPDPGIKPAVPALQADSLPLSYPGSSHT